MIIKKEYKFSEEHRRKISESKKGVKKSPETRKNISEGHKGLKFTEEHRKKIGISNHLNPRVKKHSEETLLKISASSKGENNGNWKGGITSLVRRIRGISRYRKWRESILRKDNFSCVLCGKYSPNGFNLHADHYPVPFSIILKNNNIDSTKKAEECTSLWEIGENRTVCFKCHTTTESWGGKKK